MRTIGQQLNLEYRTPCFSNPKHSFGLSKKVIVIGLNHNIYKNYIIYLDRKQTQWLET